jgi:hypothetical protein
MLAIYNYKYYNAMWHCERKMIQHGMVLYSRECQKGQDETLSMVDSKGCSQFLTGATSEFSQILCIYLHTHTSFIQQQSHLVPIKWG